MTKYLLDSCIWRDFYEDRISLRGNPLGKYASELFMRILDRKGTILFSNSLVWELKKGYDEKDIYEMLNLFVLTKRAERITITKEESHEARTLAAEKGIPLVDCLNAILARNYGAVLITQDKHYFNELKDVIAAKRPQEIT